LKSIYVSFVLLLLCVLLASSNAQGTDLLVGWKWNDGHAIPQGKESSVSITVSNAGKGLVKVASVGLHFAWMPKDTYLPGRKNERVLSLGQSITFIIAFGIPQNLTIGSYECHALITYHVTNASFLVVKEDGDIWKEVSGVYFAPQNLEISIYSSATTTETTALPSTIPIEPSSLIGVFAGLAIVILIILAIGIFSRKYLEIRIKIRIARRPWNEPISKMDSSYHNPQFSDDDGNDRTLINHSRLLVPLA